MSEPFVVLGVYKPTEWDAKKIGLDLVAITKRHGLIPHKDPAHGPLNKSRKCPWVSELLHAEVRRRTFNTEQAESWHYDGDTTPGAKPDCLMVLWSTNNPTQFQYKGKVYQAKPYEVVAAHNLTVLHRRPPAVPQKRWTFRQRCATKNLGGLTIDYNLKKNAA